MRAWRRGDGLRIFAGMLDNGMVAGPWLPSDWLGEGTDKVAVEPAPKKRGRPRKTAPAAADVAPAPKTRDGTKQAMLIAMLRRKEGATIAQIVEATGWRSHTVRGVFAGALKKKLGLNVTSEKVEGEERVYRLS